MKRSKRKFSWVVVAATAAVFFGLAVESTEVLNSARAAGPPSEKNKPEKNETEGKPVKNTTVNMTVQVINVDDRIVATATTNKTGRFNFDKLIPGEYVLRLVPVPPPTKSTGGVSSTASLDAASLAKPGGWIGAGQVTEILKSTGPGGVEKHNVSIALRMEEHPRSAEYEEIPIVISAKQGGRVAGRITRHPEEIAIKEEGM